MEHNILDERHERLLIVDDEVNLCRGCQRIFEDEGYIMETAYTGKDGLRRATKEMYDAVLVDLKMPDMNGIDLIKQLKEYRPDVPVIMITGYASVPTAVEAMKSGADDYIPKPFNPDEIVGAVKKAIRKVTGKTKTDMMDTTDKRIIEKEQVLEVLNRTGDDKNFWTELMENGSKALEDYSLSNAAKAAIVSGDINWIENNVGELTAKQSAYLEHRLQVERW
ncbi:MAG: response regulator [Spirochaetota bacterium]|nr:response regulator [Spirochaetota bacterium]